MSNCKIYTLLLAGATALLFCGCTESRYGFDATKDIKKELFNKLPGLGNKQYGKFAVAANADSIEIYKATFAESFIEKDNLLELSELNEQSTHPRADYRNVADGGFKQDLYLMKYTFKYLTPKLKKVPVTAVIFFSLRYRPQKEAPFMYCTGPGPAYWGSVNMNYISFDSILSIKKNDSGYYLSAGKVKKKNKKYPFNLLFMPADFPLAVDRDSAALNIRKIVRVSPNKVGGEKPIVFNITEIFHDTAALQFNYDSTLYLKQ